MKIKYLVTTSDTKLLSKTDDKILLLGKWCLPDYTVKDFPPNIEVMPYHWDDRKKMYRDYVYLQKLYEKALSDLILELNMFHNIKHGERYWRILIGPWLYVFIQTLFDRWELVRTAADLYDIKDTIVLNFKSEKFILSEFKEINPDDSEWAHYLFSEALKFQNRIPWHEVEPKLSEVEKIRPLEKFDEKVSLNNRIFSFLNILLYKLQWQTEIFVINTYLPRWSTIKLQLALGQVPKLWQVPPSPKLPPNMDIRANWIISSDSDDEFYQFLLKMLPLQLPTVYVEGYKSLCESVARLPWPSKPSRIFTSNLFQFSEVFQAWAASKVEKGSSYVIGQHGGLYGLGKWHCGEEHQVKTSDRFITWGWTDSRKSIYPGFTLTNVGKPMKTWKSNGDLLLVTAPIRLFGYKNISWPMGPNQAASFLDDQLSFIENLSNNVRKQLVVRVNKIQDEKMQTNYFKKIGKHFKDVELDDSSFPIEEKIKECRIFVYSCNSTGYLETLARDIPTVIFWDPEHFELRDSALPFFEKLKDAGIFHDNSITASNHISNIWDDVSEWWNSSRVQSIRKEFCKNYSKESAKPIYELIKAIKC